MTTSVSNAIVLVIANYLMLNKLYVESSNT